MAHIMYYIFLLNFVSHSYPVDAWGVFFFKMDGWMDNLDGAFFAGYQFRLFHFSLFCITLLYLVSLCTVWVGLYE